MPVVLRNMITQQERDRLDRKTQEERERQDAIDSQIAWLDRALADRRRRWMPVYVDRRIRQRRES